VPTAPTAPRTENAAPSPADPGPAAVAEPLAKQVFNTLRGWIVSGSLEPGSRLRVRDVAEMVGTSVMPVREAIRQLSEAGLVIHEPYKGARVRGLSTAELEQAYDVRRLLEGEAARLGAASADATVVAGMRAHHEALTAAAQAGDVTETLHRDEELLDELYRLADNPILLEIVHSLWDRCRPYKALWAGGPDRLGQVEIWAYQTSLIDAVEANDGKTAETIVRDLYAGAKVALRAMLTSSDAWT
jgi:DNA-binding GntR family transcriptional regulator